MSALSPQQRQRIFGTRGAALSPPQSQFQFGAFSPPQQQHQQQPSSSQMYAPPPPALQTAPVTAAQQDEYLLRSSSNQSAGGYRSSSAGTGGLRIPSRAPPAPAPAATHQQSLGWQPPAGLSVPGTTDTLPVLPQQPIAATTTPSSAADSRPPWGTAATPAAMFPHSQQEATRTPPPQAQYTPEQQLSLAGLSPVTAMLLADESTTHTNGVTDSASAARPNTGVASPRSPIAPPTSPPSAPPAFAEQEDSEDARRARRRQMLGGGGSTAPAPAAGATVPHPAQSVPAAPTHATVSTSVVHSAPEAASQSFDAAGPSSSTTSVPQPEFPTSVATSATHVASIRRPALGHVHLFVVRRHDGQSLPVWQSRIVALVTALGLDGQGEGRKKKSKSGRPKSSTKSKETPQADLDEDPMALLQACAVVRQLDVVTLVPPPPTPDNAHLQAWAQMLVGADLQSNRQSEADAAFGLSGSGPAIINQVVVQRAAVLYRQHALTIPHFSLLRLEPANGVPTPASMLSTSVEVNQSLPHGPRFVATAALVPLSNSPVLDATNDSVNASAAAAGGTEATAPKDTMGDQDPFSAMHPAVQSLMSPSLRVFQARGARSTAAAAAHQSPERSYTQGGDDHPGAHTPSTRQPAAPIMELPVGILPVPQLPPGVPPPPRPPMLDSTQLASMGGHQGHPPGIRLGSPTGSSFTIRSSAASSPSGSPRRRGTPTSARGRGSSNTSRSRPKPSEVVGRGGGGRNGPIEYMGSPGRREGGANSATSSARPLSPTASSLQRRTSPFPRATTPKSRTAPARKQSPTPAAKPTRKLSQAEQSAVFSRLSTVSTTTYDTQRRHRLEDIASHKERREQEHVARRRLGSSAASSLESSRLLSSHQEDDYGSYPATPTSGRSAPAVRTPSGSRQLTEVRIERRHRGYGGETSPPHASPRLDIVEEGRGSVAAAATVDNYHVSAVAAWDASYL